MEASQLGFSLSLKTSSDGIADKETPGRVGPAVERMAQAPLQRVGIAAGTTENAF